MSVLGSVKSRIKTMIIINRNKKKKQLAEQIEEDKKIKKIVVINPNLTTKVYNKPLNVKKIKNRPINSHKVGKKSIEINSNDAQNNPKKIEIIPKSDILNKEHLILRKPPKREQKISFKKSPNSKEELKIISRVNLFLDNTKKEIKKLKSDLSNEQEKLTKIKDKESLQKEEQKIEEIHNKIVELTDIIEKLALQYDFKYYEQLKDELLFQYIDDFKFKNSLTNIDSLVEKCQIEAKKLDYLNLLNIKLNELERLKDNKKNKINNLETDYDNKTVDLIKLDRKEELIKSYLSKEEEYISKLSAEINDLTIDKTVSSKLVLDKNYVNNLFRLGVGISAFQTTFVGAFIGAFIIKSATSNLLKGAFSKKTYTNYFYKYQEFTNKIKTNLDLLDETLYLVNNSLEDIVKLRMDMENTYGDYLENSKYKEMYKKIVEMEKYLLRKEKETIEMKQKLKLKQEENKEKQKKLKDINIS